MSRIYLDHNASTAVRPEVLEAMLPYFTEHFGNASSVHAFGQEAKGGLEDARAQVAALLNAAPGEIVFTSGGTESDNLGVIGGARAVPFKGRHVIVSAIEHDAVRHAADALEREGFTVTRVAPDERGVVHAEAIAAAIRPDTWCSRSRRSAPPVSAAAWPSMWMPSRRRGRSRSTYRRGRPRWPPSRGTRSTARRGSGRST